MLLRSCCFGSNLLEDAAGFKAKEQKLMCANVLIHASSSQRLCLPDRRLHLLVSLSVCLTRRGRTARRAASLPVARARPPFVAMKVTADSGALTGGVMLL